MCNKGICVKNILQYYEDVDCILCIGDDKTDEDMFKALHANLFEQKNVQLFTCIVGFPERSAAKYFCENPESLLNVLSKLG